jgi:cysteine desulfurase
MAEQTARIYLDNAATTMPAPEVIEVMIDVMKNQFGNPSSIYREGRAVRAAIENARKTIAQTINASLGEVFFTSGGTESNNMVLKNALQDLGIQTIISSPVEHHCVLHTVEHLEKQGVHVVLLQPDAAGQISVAQIEEALADNPGPVLVSLMHGNNEIGNLIDLAAVGQICRHYGAYFHTDTVQTFAKLPIDVQSMGIHFLSGSAHKIYGPKGVGFVFISHECGLTPYIHGGSQERNMRAGTENVAGIIGFGKAVSFMQEKAAAWKAHTGALRTYMRRQLREHFADVQFNGSQDDTQSLPHILSVSFAPNMQTELLIFNLDVNGIAASGGSACSSGSEVGSHVIAALGGDLKRHTVRFSFGLHNTFEEIDRVVEALRRIV